MNEEKSFDLKTLASRIQVISEMVEAKTSQLSTLSENLKRVDGYVLGSKESIEKVEKYLKQQKNELKELTAQGKMSKEISSFLENVLNAILSFIKSIPLDAERLFFSKQGETAFLKQDIEKLTFLKKNHESAVKNAEKEEPKKETKEIKEEEPQRVRPDKNPHTKIGQAAIDIAERKRKAKQSLETAKENSSKKRGRKPKAI